MFRIASFSRLAGVSSKVLRDYDQLGLFRPAWVDPATGYRMYSPAQLPELRRILALRDLGLSLSEIRALVGDGANLRTVLEARRRALEEARRELDRRLAGLGITLAASDGANGPDVVVREVPDELVAVLDTATVDGEVGRAFYELEMLIRAAGVRAARPPGALVRESGAGTSANVEVFVPLSRAAAGLNVRRLPPVRAATIIHYGAYEAMPATRRVLDAWLAASGLHAADPLRLLYLQFGAEDDLRLPRQYLVERSRDLVTEIQRPLIVADEH